MDERNRERIPRFLIDAWTYILVAPQAMIALGMWAWDKVREKEKNDIL